MRQTQSFIDVPYLNLPAQHASIRLEIQDAITAVIDSGNFVLGPSVERFEDEFAQYCGNAYCVAVNNGTAALHLALVALGIGVGDEVITQANTFVATVAAILHTGAKAVLVDVKPLSYSIDVAAVERAITPRTRAIVPVHLFGQPCDLRSLRIIAQRYGVVLVEDASQAHGATSDGLRIGSGDIVTFSFYPGKNLGAAGEAGGIVVRNGALARRLRLLRNHGSETKHVHLAVGYNYRLESLQGAVLSIKLRHLGQWTLRRQCLAERYDTLLASIERPSQLPRTTLARHIYPVLVSDREEVAAGLIRRGIETNIHYPVPCHLQPAFARLGYRLGDFPHSERLAKRELSLPIYPELTEQQVDHVAQSLLAIVC